MLNPAVHTYICRYNRLNNNKKNSSVAAYGNGTGDVPANLKQKLNQMDDQIAILQSVAIAGVVFGVFGSALAVVSN